MKENCILQKEPQLDETLATATIAATADLCNELSASFSMDSEAGLLLPQSQY